MQATSLCRCSSLLADVGSASIRSARAMLSGNSSLISTNSNDWILFTSFAGTGGKQLASVNGETFSCDGVRPVGTSDIIGWEVDVDGMSVGNDDDTGGMSGKEAIEDGSRPEAGRESGSD